MVVKQCYLEPVGERFVGQSSVSGGRCVFFFFFLANLLAVS